MSVTIYDYPYSPGANNAISLKNAQSGFVATVAADGSASAAVTFPQAYTTAVSGVFLQPYGTTFDNYLLTWQPSAISLTGFTINVTGGPAGSTVSVSWLATGT